jgi:uncharacterized delta-60 repeat protein
MKKIYLLAFLFVVCLSHSQNPAGIDLTFDIEDYKPIFGGTIKRTIVQPDGKILVLGSFSKYSYHGTKDIPQKHLVRLNADMTVDPTFQPGSFSVDPDDIALLSTGKIIVLVVNGSHNGVFLSGDLVRLNQDGSRDMSYPGLYNNATGGKIFVYPDDKLLISGAQYLNKINTEGSIDDGFNTIYIWGTNLLNDFIVLPTGEIIVTANGKLQKFTSTGGGVPTAQFSPDPLGCSAKSLILQPDGKILVMGRFFDYQGSETNDYIVRLNANGTLDPTFTPLTIPVDPFAYECSGSTSINRAVLQPDGKILIGGKFASYGGINSPNLIRLNSNGTVDTSFQSGLSAEVVSITRSATGDYIIGVTPTTTGGPTQVSQYGNLLVDSVFKINSTGTLLNVNVSSQHQSDQIMLLPNNQIALIGESTKPYHRGIKLIDANGDLVVNSNLFSGFNAQILDGLYNFKSVTTAAIQPDGKIIAAGYFTSYNGTAKNHIVRLNADFSIDATFNIGTGFSGEYNLEIKSVALQADGKVLVAGIFNAYNGTPVTSNLIRLTSTGQIDPTFITSPTLPSKIVVQPDGKILLQDSYGLRRLNSNGSPDPAFTVVLDVACFALLPNGKMIVDDYYGIQRLQPNGDVDTTFNELNFGTVNCIYIQPDGKILLGGTFNSFSNPDGSYGGASQGLARLDADGNFDYAFDTGAGFNSAVNDIAMQADGKILVAGKFSRYDGAWTNGIVRLLAGDAHVLMGTVRYDNNNNGCTTSDPAYAMLKLRVTSGAITRDFITNTSGSYAIPFPSGSYTVTPVFENSAYQNLAPATIALNFPADGMVVNQDFCISALGVHPDLEVVIIPLTVARPGFNATYKIIYKNKGNQVLSGSIAMTFNDAVMDYVSASPSATMSAGNAAWNFTNFFPNETKTAVITFNINTPTETPPVNDGDHLLFSAAISSGSTDDTPADNAFTLNQTAVNSYDPNDKTCLEGTTVGTQVIGAYVHYMIRFENKGTYAAQNITVTDMIDPAKFDIASLVPLHGSHSFVTKINGNQVDFFFENINLGFTDDSNDGYVTFKIKTKSTLTQGSTFSNTASIFFDYNAAIVTNTAVTSISTLAVEDFGSEKYFTLYPNPANHTLSIYKNLNIEVTSYSVYNSIGQLIMVRTGADQPIDVSHLPTGNYFIKVATDKGTANLRFIKN